MNGGIGCHGPADRQNTEEKKRVNRSFYLIVNGIF